MRRLAFSFAFVVLMTAFANAETSPRAVTPEPAALKELQLVLKRALGSYNSVDAAGMRRQFAAQAPGLSDDGAYRRLFFRYYLEDLGRVKTMRLIPADSNFDPDRAMLVYEAVFDYWSPVKVSANFTRENAVLKLIQLRFEKIETGN